MDKTTQRRIKQYEKIAAEVAQLKKKAASLLKKADDVEAAQKSAFEALIVKAAYAAGLDALPAQAVFAGMADLAGVAKAEGSPIAKNSAAAAQLGDDDDQHDEGAIELIVGIGRNTSQKRFEVLSKYLTWNGRDGEWSGRVTPTALTKFEALFEPRRLKYTVHALQTAGGKSSNTSSQPVGNVSGTMKSEEDINSVHPVRACMPATRPRANRKRPGPVRAKTQQAGPQPSEPDHEEVTTRPLGAIEAGSYGLQGPPGTAGQVTSATSTPTEEQAPSPYAKPAATTLSPRSPFAGLRRHGLG